MSDQANAEVDKDRHAGTHPLELAYTRVCDSYESIFEFRAKLLALLPLATGTGAFLLLERAQGSLRPFLGPIGIFGFVVTAGLFFYELRGIQRCHRLEVQGRALEKKLDLGPELGPFRGQPPRAIRNMLGPPAAGLIIYLATALAWLCLAGYGFKLSINLAWAFFGFAVLLIGSWIWLSLWLKRAAFGRLPMKWEIRHGHALPRIRPRNALQVQLTDAMANVTKTQDDFKNAGPSRQRDLAGAVDQAEVEYLTQLHETLLKSRTSAAERKDPNSWWTRLRKAASSDAPTKPSS
jgi:hypothetical protein